MIAEVEITMDCPNGIMGHHQLERYLEKRLKARNVIVRKWKTGFEA